MKKFISTICILLGIFIVGISFAADEGVEIPYTFENGAIADANEVNANFDAIAQYINEKLIIVYDYGTSVDTIKTFSQTASPTTITAIVTGEGIETWEFEDGRKIEHLKAASVDGTLEIGRREYIWDEVLGDHVLTQDLTYDPPIIGVDIAGAKEVGQIWGGAYCEKKPDETIYGFETLMFSILAIEDITVPAGTFLNCIQIYKNTRAYKSVIWYAPGVGMVKYVGVLGLMELESVE